MPFLKSTIDEIKNSPLGQRLAKGALWSLIGTMVARGLGLFSAIITARILGIKGFGEFGVILNTVGMFGVFAGFGLGLTATKYVAEYYISDKVRTGKIIALSNLVAILSASLISIVVYFIAPLLATKTLAAPQLTPLIQIGTGILLFSAINGAQTGALAGFEEFKSIARINLIAGILACPIMIGGTYWGGIKGAVCASVFSLSINWLLNKGALAKAARKANIKITYRKCLEEWKILRDFSLPAFLSNIVTAPLGWVFSIILTHLPNGYTEMGILNAASQWRMVLAFLPSMIGNALLPILASHQNKNFEEYNALLNLAHKLIFIIIFPITIILMISSGLIMKSYGQGFSVGKTALIYTLAATTISCIGAPAGTVIQAQGKMWLGCIMNLSYAICSMALCYFLGPLYGATGACLAVYVTYILYTSWMYIYLQKMLSKNIITRTFAGIFLTIVITFVLAKIG